jgi:hypothetical protein
LVDLVGPFTTIVAYEWHFHCDPGSSAPYAIVCLTVAGTLPGLLAQNLAAQSSGNHMLPEALQRRIRDEQQRMWGHISAKQNSSSGAGSVGDAGMGCALCFNTLVQLVARTTPTLAGAAVFDHAFSLRTFLW